MCYDAPGHGAGDFYGPDSPRIRATLLTGLLRRWLAMTTVLNYLALHLLCHCEPRQWRGNPDNKEQTTIHWIASLHSQ